MPYNTHSDLNSDLLEVYEFNKSRGLEVVLIAFGDDQLLFEESFSQLPWLAIPHEDQHSRDSIHKLFTDPRLRDDTIAILLNPNGDVVLDDIDPTFRIFGPQGFPFSKDKLDELSYQDDLFWFHFVVQEQELTITDLLGKTIISSKGEKASYLHSICLWLVPNLSEYICFY